MSTRTNLRPQLVITNGDMTTTLTSSVTVLQSLSGASYAYSWSGTAPVGNITIEFSDDYALEPNGTVANAGTWTTAPLNVNGATTTLVPVTGNTGNAFIDILATMAYAVRTIYTPTSGTGSIKATITGKVG